MKHITRYTLFVAMVITSAVAWAFRLVLVVTTSIGDHLEDTADFFHTLYKQQQ